MLEKENLDLLRKESIICVDELMGEDESSKDDIEEDKEGDLKKESISKVYAKSTTQTLSDITNEDTKEHDLAQAKMSKNEKDKQQIDVEEFTRKLKRIARKSPGSEEFQQLEIIVTDRQAAIKHLETKIEEFTARRSRFSRELCALQEKLGNAERKLVSLKARQVEALELLKQRELVLRKNEKNLEKHEREFNQCSREKNEQEKYQRLIGRST